MSIIRDRTEALDAARALVLAHPMCLRLEESEAEITVLFPEVDFRRHLSAAEGSLAGLPLDALTHQAHMRPIMEPFQ